MIRVIRTMFSTIGGTLTLLFIDTISFCVALRLYITQSLAESPDKRLLLLATVLALVATLVTNVLLSSKKNMGFKDYAREDGFDTDEETLGLSAESINFEYKEGTYNYDSDDVEDEEEEVIEVVGSSEDTILNSKILHRIEFGSTDDSKNDINNLLDNSKTSIKKPTSKGFGDTMDISLDFDSSESLKGFDGVVKSNNRVDAPDKE